MALIIDGHNLIPKLRGMSLSDPEDEQKLIQVLQAYCRLRRKQVEVYFDRAPAGQAGEQRYGQVRAIFVPSGVSADAAIMARLKKLGRRARNVTVVSSDRQVQQAARALHATVRSAEDFAKEWETLSSTQPELDFRNQPLSEEDLAYWERLFARGDDQNRTN